MVSKQQFDSDLRGKALLSDALQNKGCAFSDEERLEKGLLGLLPHRVETLEEQAQRHYEQFESFQTNMEKNIYLNVLLNTNETLFYYLLSQHMEQMLPVIYTPTVGDAVQKFSLQFRRERGRYINYPHQKHMHEMLGGQVNPDIDILVITDGGAILGIGDQGVGGMAISVGKAIVYALCAGIDPKRILPIQLDVGTDNSSLIEQPGYLGWRHERIKGEAYIEFMDQFVEKAHELYPNAILHWEDFDRDNASLILKRYENDLCTFNDDMQGTGAVTLAAILAALKKGDLGALSEQRIVIHGAGAAALGIADQVVHAMVEEGLSEEAARSCFWILNSRGLLTEKMTRLSEAQQAYCQPESNIESWHHEGELDLETVVKHVKPTVLIGCSTVKDAFNEKVVKEMASHVKRPVIMPLSNPSSKSEANPQDLFDWTCGQALVATGSPFDPVTYQGELIPVAQCNNAFIYPGLGFGLVISKAQRLNPTILFKASQALARYVDEHPDDPRLLPPLSVFPDYSKSIAMAVADAVADEGYAACQTPFSEEVEAQFWRPSYD